MIGSVRLRLALLALLLAVAACGRGPALPRIGAADVILAFGDSLTYGTGATEEQSYPAVLGKLINRKVVRAGVPGEVTEQGLRRLPEALDEHRPALVLLCLGGNDILRRVPPGQTRSNLQAMLDLLKRRNIPVVLIGVPQPQLLAGPPEYYAELAKEFGVPYEGSVVKDVLYSPSLKSDPIHPNAQGYAQMAEGLARLLKKTGAVD